jgi:iron complex outermembrane recepter protein
VDTLITPVANPSAFVDLGTLGPATVPDVWNISRADQHLAICALRRGHLCDHRPAQGNGRGCADSTTTITFRIFRGLGLAARRRNAVQNHVTQSQTSMTPKFNLAYEFDKDLMVYGTIAKGFRPGGGNEPLPTTGPLWSGLPVNSFHYATNNWPSTYSPDTVWNYEIGEKARFFDRHLTLNSSIYYENGTTSSSRNCPTTIR